MLEQQLHQLEPSRVHRVAQRRALRPRAAPQQQRRQLVPRRLGQG